MSAVADRVIDVAAPPPSPVGLAERARAYLSLMKLRIVELLLVTTVPSMLLARAGRPDLWLIAVVLVGGCLAAGAANVLNCYLDRDIDPLMRRTARRALPSHVISPRAALSFGLTLAAAATLVMAVFTTWLATLLTVVAIAYYDLVYTLWLKRTTPLNTVWGGVCGAMPVLIGWAAVTGSLAWPAWIMFAIVFCWQPPHFYALAIRFRDDYARAGIPMLPVVASARRVGAEAVVYAWLTLTASVGLWTGGSWAGRSWAVGSWAGGVVGWVYLVPAIVAGALFVAEAHGLYRRIRTGQALRPMRLFHASTTYLTIVFVAIAVDALLRG